MVTSKLFEALVEELSDRDLVEQPRTPGAELRGDLRDCYKIQAAQAGLPVGLSG